VSESARPAGRVLWRVAPVGSRCLRQNLHYERRRRTPTAHGKNDSCLSQQHSAANQCQPAAAIGSAATARRGQDERRCRGSASAALCRSVRGPRGRRLSRGERRDRMLPSRSQWLSSLDALSAVCRSVAVELQQHGDLIDDIEAYAPWHFRTGLTRLSCSPRRTRRPPIPEPVRPGDPAPWHYSLFLP